MAGLDKLGAGRASTRNHKPPYIPPNPITPAPPPGELTGSGQKPPVPEGPRPGRSIPLSEWGPSIPIEPGTTNRQTIGGSGMVWMRPDDPETPTTVLGGIGGSKPVPAENPPKAKRRAGGFR